MADENLTWLTTKLQKIRRNHEKIIQTFKYNLRIKLELGFIRIKDKHIYVQQVQEITKGEKSQHEFQQNEQAKQTNEKSLKRRQINKQLYAQEEISQSEEVNIISKQGSSNKYGNYNDSNISQGSVRRPERIVKKKTKNRQNQGEQCCICNEVFRSILMLNQHIQLDHEISSDKQEMQESKKQVKNTQNIILQKKQQDYKFKCPLNFNLQKNIINVASIFIKSKFNVQIFFQFINKSQVAKGFNLLQNLTVTYNINFLNNLNVPIDVNGPYRLKDKNIYIKHKKQLNFFFKIDLFVKLQKIYHLIFYILANINDQNIYNYFLRFVNPSIRYIIKIQFIILQNNLAVFLHLFTKTQKFVFQPCLNGSPYVSLLHKGFYFFQLGN
ncbi:hypothetical protein pb186bvf_016137 [Paramecium bursaria]